MLANLIQKNARSKRQAVRRLVTFRWLRHRHLKWGILLVPVFAGLSFLASFVARPGTTQFSGRLEKGIAEMYDEDDLSSCCLFKGNLINFGYWDSEVAGTIREEERIESARKLYRVAVDRLNIQPDDEVLEIACGQGTGSALVMEEFAPKLLCAIDLSECQVKRSRQINQETIKKHGGRLTYRLGRAEKIPFERHTFDCVYSIEAAQHFEDLDCFIGETGRVLKPGGRVVVATFFGTSKSSHNRLSKLVQTARDGIDKIWPIQNVEQKLIKAGFRNVKVESIGRNVWQGFDKWVSQGDLSNSWTRNWYKGYKKGLVDYYIVSAVKNNEDIGNLLARSLIRYDKSQKQPLELLNVGISVDKLYLISLITILAIVGIKLIRFLDVNIYHRQLRALFQELTTLEELYKTLQKPYTVMAKVLHKKYFDPVMVDSMYYSVLSFIAAVLGCFALYAKISPNHPLAALLVSFGAISLFLIWELYLAVASIYEGNSRFKREIDKIHTHYE